MVITGSVTVVAPPRAAQALIPEHEDALVQSTLLHTTGAARAMATAAQLRYHAQAEQHRRFKQAQSKDERSIFIYGLVSAYVKKDDY